jgi:hypothetical protein
LSNFLPLQSRLVCLFLVFAGESSLCLAAHIKSRAFIAASMARKKLTVRLRSQAEADRWHAAASDLKYNEQIHSNPSDQLYQRQREQTRGD